MEVYGKKISYFMQREERVNKLMCCVKAGPVSKLPGCENVVLRMCRINPYPTAFPYGNGMVLHFYQQQESSTTKTVHRVINKRLKTYV